MPIRYALHRNERIAGESGYVARVHSLGTLDKEAMIDRCCEAGTTVARADISAVWELMESVGERALLDGRHVHLPLAILTVAMQGTYEGYDDRFDPRRHRVVPRLRPNSRLRRTIRLKARPSRMHASELHPVLSTYYDVSTGLFDRVLTPGNIGCLHGLRLKFDPGDPRQGIFFLCADGTVVQITMVAENRPRKLIFLVPPLADGPYKLAVRTALGGGHDLVVGFSEGVLHVGPLEPLLEGPAERFPVVPRLPE